MGIPVLAEILFETSLNALALFNHSSLKQPRKLDKNLRKIIIWDKLFSTYAEKPRANYPEMQLGLAEFSANAPLNLYDLLLLPFTKLNK